MYIWYDIAYNVMTAYLILCPLIMIVLDWILGSRANLAQRDLEWKMFVGELALLEYRMAQTVKRAKEWMKEEPINWRPTILDMPNMYWAALRRQVDASVKISMDHLRGCIGEV